MYERLTLFLARLLRIELEKVDDAATHEKTKVFKADRAYLTMMRVLGVIAIIIGFFLEKEYGNYTGFFWILIPDRFVPVATAFGLCSLAWGWVLMHLQYEARRYTITERSLHIAEGLWVRKEMRMTFANIQNVKITQGPLGRLFGLKTLVVETAGGGGGNPLEGNEDNMHTGEVRGIKNAEEIQALIRARMEQSRQGEPVLKEDAELKLLKGISAQFERLAENLGRSLTDFPPVA